MIALKAEIAANKRKKHGIESKKSKIKAALDKWSKLGKRAGFDLEALYREDKNALFQAESLAQNQSALQSKNETLLTLKEKLKSAETKRQEQKIKMQNSLRKKLRMANLRLQTTLALRSNTTRKTLVDPISSTATSVPSSVDQISLNDMPAAAGGVSRETSVVVEHIVEHSQQSIEEKLAQMEKIFVLETEEELKMTRALEEEFKQQFKEAREKAIHGKESNKILLNHNRKMFQVIDDI
jgi:hypothetical protein